MLDRVRNILSEFTDFPVEKMTENTELENDLGLNSLDVINVVVAFEDELGIEIPDRIIKDFHSIGDIVKFIKKYA